MTGLQVLLLYDMTLAYQPFFHFTMHLSSLKNVSQKCHAASMFYRNYRFICPRARFPSSTQDFYRNTQEILNSGIFLMKQHCRKGFVNTERVQNSTTHKDSCRWPKCGRNCRLFLVNYLFHVLHLHCIVINKLIFVKLFDLTKHVLSSKQGLARINAFLLSPNLTVYSVNCTSVQYSYPPTLTAVLKGLWDEKVQL